MVYLEPIEDFVNDPSPSPLVSMYALEAELVGVITAVDFIKNSIGTDYGLTVTLLM